VEVIRSSSLYLTEPVGGPDQDEFLNAVAELSTSQNPSRLFSRLQQIERELDRVPAPRWGSRSIDIDILAIESLIYRDAALIVPHVRLAERRFVLVPFAEIAAGFYVYGTRRRVAGLLRDTPDTHRVTWYAPASAIANEA